MFDEYMYILLRTQINFNYKAHYLNSLFGNDYKNTNKDYAVLHLSNLANDGYVEKTTVPAQIGPNNTILKKTYSTLKYNDKFFALDLETLHKQTFTFDINSLSKTELKRIKKKIELELTSPTIISSSGSYYKFNKTDLKNPNAVRCSEYYYEHLYNDICNVKDDENFRFNLMINDIDIEKTHLSLEHIFIQNNLCRYYTGTVERLLQKNKSLSVNSALSYAENILRDTFLNNVITPSINSSSMLRTTLRLQLIGKSSYHLLKSMVTDYDTYNSSLEKVANELNSIDWYDENNILHRANFSKRHVDVLLKIASIVNRFYPFNHQTGINMCGKIIRSACKDLPGDVDTLILYFFNKLKKMQLFKEARQLMINSGRCIDLSLIHKTVNNKEIIVSADKPYVMQRNILRKQENALIFRIHKEVISTYVDVTLLTDDGSESDNEFNLHLKSKSEFNLVLRLFNDLNKKE